MVIADIDNVRFAGGDDQIIEGAGLLEPIVVIVEFLDVPPGGVAIDAEDLLLQTLHRLAVKGHLFAHRGQVIAAQEWSPFESSLSSSRTPYRRLRGTRQHPRTCAGSFAAPKTKEKTSKLRNI